MHGEHGEEKGVEEVLGIQSPGRGGGGMGEAVDLATHFPIHVVKGYLSLRFPVTPKRAVAVR